MASKKEAQPETESEDGAEGAADGAAASGKRKLSLKIIIIIAAGAFVVLGGGGTGAYFLFHGHAEAEAADRTQYLKIKVVLELPDPKLTAEITPVMPRVMDAFQTYLRELRPTDLDGSAGLYRLKEELTRRVNAAIAPNRINAVLFKEIVVQ